MEELRGVELLPEPGEPKILSAVDPSTAGHEGEWRAEVTGWAPVLPAVSYTHLTLPTNDQV